MVSDRDRLSWTVGRSASAEPPRTGIERLARFVREALAESFPEDQGYRRRGTRLVGCIQGLEVVVRRGDFEGLVSVQCYERGFRSEVEEVELRLVASGGSRLRRRAEHVGERAARRCRAVGWLAGTGGAGAIAAVMGLVLSPTLLPLSVPAMVMVWLAGLVSGRSIGRRLLARLEAGAAIRALADPEYVADLERWRGLLKVLADRHDLEAMEARPFRGRSDALTPAAGSGSRWR